VPPAPQPALEIIAEPEPPPVPPLKLETISDGMEVTIDQLDAVYRADTTGAHGKFNGKTVVVKGTVEKVFVREQLEIRYIVLRGVNRKTTWNVRGTFNKEEAMKLNRMNEGTVVRVRGKYDGYSKNIMLKDCALL
jgi:hypothetical protein